MSEAEIREATNSYRTPIAEGVFYGKLKDNREVAVKVFPEVFEEGGGVDFAKEVIVNELCLSRQSEWSTPLDLPFVSWWFDTEKCMGSMLLTLFAPYFTTSVVHRSLPFQK